MNVKGVNTNLTLLAGRDKSNLDNGERRREYRYGLYAHKLITVDGEIYTRHFIVVKNRFGLISSYTRLHNYVGVYDSHVFSPLVSDAEAKLRYVCVMLNYVLLRVQRRNVGTAEAD